MVSSYDGKYPRIDQSVFVATSAHVIGDVSIGKQSSIWFNAVVRGDVEAIHIGARTNVQDGAIIHVSSGRWPTHIGNGVTVAHAVVLHGCTVGDGSLIGIGAIVLDGAEIGESCLIAAGSLVTPGTKIPAGYLALGRPARPQRELSKTERDRLDQSAAHYVSYAERYRDQGIA